MRKIEEIVVHYSASSFGSAIVFDDWHRNSRNWRMIGYHFVIQNGQPDKDSYWPLLDGHIEPGRPLNNDPYIDENEQGAHVRFHNRNSVGVCLVGNEQSGFTDQQMNSLYRLLKHLLYVFGLKVENVKGHFEYSEADTKCPNMDMDNLRVNLAKRIAKVNYE